MDDGSFKIVPKIRIRRFRRREGDWAQEGGNNTLIVMGTDRAVPGGGPATVGDGSTAVGSAKDDGHIGTIHVVTGRKDADGNTDLVGDDSALYLSSRTNPDSNLAVDGAIGGQVEWKYPKTVPAAILRSDNIRIVYRNSGDIRILSDGAKSFLVMDDNYLDVGVSEKIFMSAGDTRMEIRSSGDVKLGPLAAALSDLISSLVGAISDSQIVSMNGNLGAPVPFNSAMPGGLKFNMLSKLNAWKSKWLSEDFINKA